MVVTAAGWAGEVKYPPANKCGPKPMPPPMPLGLSSPAAQSSSGGNRRRGRPALKKRAGAEL